MTTTKRVIQEIAGSGLMAVGDLRCFYEGLDAKPTDGSSLTDALVRAGKLTRYQESCILRQKANMLCLGRYVILEKLGEGGMGTVYKASHRHMKRFVALKVLSRKLLRSRQVLERFQREVQVAACLHHPNIVTAFDADVVGKVHFLVMEYVDGTNLHTYVAQNGPLPVGLAIKFLAEAARGLDYAHGRGIVHRDIKPGNLLVGRDSVVRVADMGLARLAEWSESSQPENLTAAGSILGTLDYMAPEQAMNIQGADCRSDIYSLGCTLHYLLTGRPIYTGNSPTEILLAHRERAIPSLTGQCRDLPVGLDSLFRRMVAKRPDDRLPGMSDVIEALQALSSTGPGNNEPAGSSGGGTFEPELASFLRALGTTAPATSPTLSTSETDRCRAHLVMTTPVDIGKPQRRLAGQGNVSKPAAGQVQAKPSNRPQVASRRSLSNSPPKQSRSKSRSWIMTGAAALGVSVVVMALLSTDGLSWFQSLAPFTSQQPSLKTTPAERTMPPGDQAATLVASAPVGPDYALNFEAPGSYVSVPTLDFAAQSPFTIEALVRVPDTTNGEVVTVLGWHNVACLTYCGATRVLGFNAGLALHVYSRPLRSGSEHIHVAVVWDGRYLTMYVDGRRQQRPLIVDKFPPAAQSVFAIGTGIGGQPAQPVESAGCFTGCVDEVRLSSIARYKGTFSPSRRLGCDAVTVCLFHCDEGHGAVLLDASPNGHLGHVHGAGWVSPAATGHEH